ncbi:MAG: toxin-antitoxin system TumE family protein [Desulfuromonadaceae bacterium]
MKAALISHDRFNDPFGNLVEMKLWSVPVNDHTLHGVKYSLVYIVNGVRVVGYDNERGKGDHKHIEGAEISYTFIDVDALVKDFRIDVEEFIRRRYES